MNRLTYILFIILYTTAFAFSQTEPEKPKTRKLAFTLVPLEVGAMIPLKNKKNDALPEPINRVANQKTTEFGFNLLKLGLVYDDKYGIEAFYNFFSQVDYQGSTLKSYVEKKYPGYDPPEKVNYRYTNERIRWTGWQGGLFYRIKINKRIYVEPKFQMGFEKYSQDNFEYFLKEHGSNQFIEYSVRSEDPKSVIPSYHYILNTAWKCNPGSKRLKLDVGLKFEYIYMNVNLKYTVTEQAYGQTALVSHYNVKQPLNLLVIGVYGKFSY